MHFRRPFTAAFYELFCLAVFAIRHLRSVCAQRRTNAAAASFAAATESNRNGALRSGGAPRRWVAGGGPFAARPAVPLLRPLADDARWAADGGVAPGVGDGRRCGVVRPPAAAAFFALGRGDGGTAAQPAARAWGRAGLPGDWFHASGDACASAGRSARHASRAFVTAPLKAPAQRPPRSTTGCEERGSLMARRAQPRIQLP